MASVKIIPPREVRPDVLRVAAYCRVSSDSADQRHSYASQIRSYTEEIERRAGWELVDIYADEGLTGTRMEQRYEFNRLLADCRKGKIDRILVKSISRFARNTRDCLAVLRELSELGVTVYFEKENIDTGTLTTELMVSVSGSLAQEESVSISKNVRQAIQRKMAQGEFITTNPPLGYALTDGCRLKIVESEAEIVRWIFGAYLHGDSTRAIAEALTRRGARTTERNTVWNPRSVQLILTNEKYMGDTLCRKRYTTESFPFTVKRNDGQVEQYYIENSHPAIISRETFAQVQHLRSRRLEKRETEKKSYPLSGKIVCGQCGTRFQRRTTQCSRISWVCRLHDEGKEKCPVGRIPESEIYAAFVRMYNKLKFHADILLSPALAQLDDLNAALHRDNPAMLAVNRAIAEAAERSHKISILRSRGLLDDEICMAQLRDSNARLAELRRERRRLLKNEDLEETIEAIRRTAGIIRSGPEQLEAFDESLFAELVEKITAESQTRIRFRLCGGIELTEELRRCGR